MIPIIDSNRNPHQRITSKHSVNAKELGTFVTPAPGITPIQNMTSCVGIDRIKGAEFIGNKQTNISTHIQIISFIMLVQSIVLTITVVFFGFYLTG